MLVIELGLIYMCGLGQRDFRSKKQYISYSWIQIYDGALDFGGWVSFRVGKYVILDKGSLGPKGNIT